MPQRAPCVLQACRMQPMLEPGAEGRVGPEVSKCVLARPLTLLCHHVPRTCAVSYVQDGLGVPRKNPCKSTATTSWPPAATCTVFMNTAPTSTVSMLLSRPVHPKPAVPHGVERGVLTQPVCVAVLATDHSPCFHTPFLSNPGPKNVSHQR